MAVFSKSPEDWQRLDWQILRDGGIHLYYSQEILEEDIEWLKAEQYSVSIFDCKKWENEASFHQEIKIVLHFPDYYGQNLNALNDCLSDLDVPDIGGMGIVFQHYDSFQLNFPELAHGILDIFSLNIRLLSLTGQRLLVLLQSNNPKIQFESYGGTVPN